MVGGAARSSSSLLSVRVGSAKPLYGLITLAAEQSNSPTRPQAGAVVQIQIVPETTTGIIMCRLVNEYRVKHGLKPVQLDDAVTREAQVSLS